MSYLTKALAALDVTEYVIEGADPTTEAEFNQRFKLIIGEDANFSATLSSDLSGMSVSWSDISAKMTELSNAEPMRRLREERDKRLADTDWWASSDLTITAAQTTYRQALRDITTQTPSLDSSNNLTGITWPTKPE